MNTTITELNDRFRQGDMKLLQYMISVGVQALARSKQVQLIRLVQSFDQFTPDNDPYKEHDFGRVSMDGRDYFWKIDYYDPTERQHSDDPASPNATRRVLLLMLSSEY